MGAFFSETLNLFSIYTMAYYEPKYIFLFKSHSTYLFSMASFS